MLKALIGSAMGILVVAIGGYLTMPHLMFNEVQSPFGFEETIARIQHNIEGTHNSRPMGGPWSGCATQPAPWRWTAAMCCQ